MRIALVNYTLAPPGRGGAERCVRALAEHLSGEHDVTVFSQAETSLNGVRCVQLRALDDPLPDAHPLHKMLVHARDLWMPSVHFALRRWLTEHSIELVNTHETQGLSSAAFTAVASLGLPHVHTAHDPNILCARIGMDRGGEFCGGRCLTCRPQRIIRGRAAAARLDALIAPSDSLRRMHIEAGVVDSDKAVLIRQGVESGHRRVREPDGSRLELGFIGKLIRPKGVLTLLRAAEHFHSDWRLSVAGSGPLEPEVVAAARDNPRVEYLGYVTGDAKHEFFDRIDLLLIPSEWEDPAPLVATEAAIRGIPAVVSHRGGLPETPHCEVFRGGDADSLMQAIKNFVSSGLLRGASEALLREGGNFAFSRYAHETEHVLAKVASGEPLID